MLSRYSRISTMAVLVLAITTLVSCGFYMSPQNRSVELEIGKNAIDVANQITGLNELPNLQITANKVWITEAADDTPVPLVRQRLINRPLWKVSYKIGELVHRKKVNSHIVGFDVYVDTSTDQVLKIVSRDAPGLPEEYRIGIKVSNQQIASYLNENKYWLSNQLPQTPPGFRFVDKLKGMYGAIVRHYECYYFLFKYPEVDGGAIIPAWMIIYYGTEPIPPSGGAFYPQSPIVLSLAEQYRRTIQMYRYDAMSGKMLGGWSTTGSNEDTFD